ncbi:MAG: DegV family EDD domain-containing protein [Anaerolineae bacterium]|nr:DegV family EDD domain-containing protein [Anaerolineae bacterium]
MANARVVTDSAAELDPGVAEELGITVVPWRIRTGEEIVPDGPGLRNASFYGKRARGRSSLSALPPTAGDLTRVYERLARETEEIVSIHPSPQLAPLVRIANELRRSFTGRCRIHALNGQFMSRALGLLVVEAAKAAAAGMPGEDIARWVNGLIPYVYLAFYVDAPRKVVRPNASVDMEEWGGTATFTPLLLIEEGEIVPLLRSRRRGTPVERLVEFVTEFEGLRHVTVIHAGLREEIDPLKAQLSEALPDLAFEEHIYGPVLASRIGADAIGVVVFEASP